MDEWICHNILLFIVDVAPYLVLSGSRATAGKSFEEGVLAA
jgi:hypothetical protein